MSAPMSSESPSPPVRKRAPRTEVIECEAVPLEPHRPGTRQQRSSKLLWLIPVCIIAFLLFKILAIFAIALLVLFALPRLLPGGVLATIKQFFGRMGR